jgi:hypothetical protein
MMTLSIRLSRIMAPMKISSAIAMTTVSHTGWTAASPKPSTMNSTSLTALTTLSP